MRCGYSQLADSGEHALNGRLGVVNSGRVRREFASLVRSGLTLRLALP